MKLNELNLEPKQTKQMTGHDYASAIHRQANQVSLKNINVHGAAALRARSHIRPDQIKFAGSGAYATVYKLPRQTNTVLKLGRTHPGWSEKDGYMAFIELVQQYGQDNPYLPQVHSFKKMKDRTGTLFYKAKLEELQPFPGYGTKDLTGEVFEVLKKILQRDDDGVRTYLRAYYSVARPYASLIEILKKLVEEPNHPSLKELDPQLLAAGKLIRKAARDSKTDEDIGLSNIMLRRTPYGPQLVITDPLA